FCEIAEPVSAVLAIAEPHRIKRSHRRRGKVTSGRFVQRYYDPVIGRFLSVDPVETDPNTGASFNRYAYANNNPYRFTDPDGRISKELENRKYIELDKKLVARIDQFKRGGEDLFEVHIYKNDAGFEKAALTNNTEKLAKFEQGTLNQGGWGKHGINGKPEMSDAADKSFRKLISNQMSKQGWLHRVDGVLKIKPSALRLAGQFSKFMGPVGIIIESSRTSVDRACDQGLCP
ncbi:MAG: RHS repeat-associated core domain-containing protein, partial [Arenimonas sp.]